MPLLSKTEYRYIYKVAVRDRSVEQDIDDISFRINAEQAFGHGGRHPMPEIELTQNVEGTPSPIRTPLLIH